MTLERLNYLQFNAAFGADLTTEEMKEGWHFCNEFDYLLTQGEEIDEQGRCAFCLFDKRLVK